MLLWIVVRPFKHGTRPQVVKSWCKREWTVAPTKPKVAKNVVGRSAEPILISPTIGYNCDNLTAVEGATV